MRWLLVMLVACSFKPGRFESDAEPATDVPVDEPQMVMIDAALDASIDARMCPPAPDVTCTAFTCAGSSSCYYHCGKTNQTESNWVGANAACGNAGLGCLVTIDSQAEQDCITQKTMPVYATNLIWIGYHQPPGTGEPLAGWQWQCGSSGYTPTAWGMGGAGSEPNQMGEEDCAALTTGGGWFDANCTSAIRYVCELP